MKAWKRTAAMLLCIAACAGFAGCGLAKETGNLVKDVTKMVKGFTEGEEPYYTLDPDLKPLDADDFNVYEDGKAVLTTDEMGEYGFNFQYPFSGHMREDYKGAPYDFREQDIVTKRGIGVGSTINEVAAAYDDIGFALLMKEGVDTFDISIEEIREIVNKAKRDEETTFYTERYITKDGQILTTAGVHQYVKENHLVGEYVVSHMEEFFDEAWSMWFHVKNGSVTGIGLGDDLHN